MRSLKTVVFFTGALCALALAGASPLFARHPCEQVVNAATGEVIYESDCSHWTAAAVNAIAIKEDGKSGQALLIAAHPNGNVRTMTLQVQGEIQAVAMLRGTSGELPAPCLGPSVLSCIEANGAAFIVAYSPEHGHPNCPPPPGDCMEVTDYVELHVFDLYGNKITAIPIVYNEGPGFRFTQVVPSPDYRHVLLLGSHTWPFKPLPWRLDVVPESMGMVAFVNLDFGSRALASMTATPSHAAFVNPNEALISSPPPDSSFRGGVRAYGPMIWKADVRDESLRMFAEIFPDPFAANTATAKEIIVKEGASDALDASYWVRLLSPEATDHLPSGESNVIVTMKGDQEVRREGLRPGANYLKIVGLDDRVLALCSLPFDLAGSMPKWFLRSIPIEAEGEDVDLPLDPALGVALDLAPLGDDHRALVSTDPGQRMCVMPTCLQGTRPEDCGPPRCWDIGALQTVELLEGGDLKLGTATQGPLMPDIEGPAQTLTEAPAELIAIVLADPESGETPLATEVTLDAVPDSVPIAQWLLDPGDGSPAIEGNDPLPQTFKLVYEAKQDENGVPVETAYHIVGKVTDTAGHGAKTETHVTVLPPRLPKATLTVDPEEGVSPHLAKITLDAEAGSHEIVSWDIDFGNGSPIVVGTDPLPQTFEQVFEALDENGQLVKTTFTIRAEVTDAAGFEDHPEAKVTVEPPRPPELLLEVSPNDGHEPMEVSIKIDAELGSYEIAGWLVEFGDGSFQDGTDLPAAFSHTYLAQDTDGRLDETRYTLKATVTDIAGLSDEREVEITVLPPTPPEASLSAQPTKGPERLTVTATLSAKPRSYPLARWEVDFGDDPSENQKGTELPVSLRKVYVAKDLNGDGISDDTPYTLKGTVWDTRGLAHSKSVRITVQANKRPRISQWPTRATYREGVLSTALLGYAWDPDGTANGLTVAPLEGIPGTNQPELVLSRYLNFFVVIRARWRPDSSQVGDHQPVTLTVRDARGGESRKQMPFNVRPRA